MQQIIPFHQSSVDIHFNSNLVVMTTENVARLCLKEPAVSPVVWHQRAVEIDGSVVTMVKNYEDGKLNKGAKMKLILRVFA